MLVVSFKQVCNRIVWVWFGVIYTPHGGQVGLYLDLTDESNSAKPNPRIKACPSPVCGQNVPEALQTAI